MLTVVILGVLCGVLASLPYFIALKQVPKITPESNFSISSLLMLSVIISFAILFCAILLCNYLCKEQLLCFAISAAVALVVLSVIFAVINLKKYKNKNKK